MDVDNLRKIIKSNNEIMEQTSAPETGQLVDKFIGDVSEKIQEMYSNNRGFCFYGKAKQIGIAITEANHDIITFSSLDNWILGGNESFKDDYNLMTFWEFIAQPSDELEFQRIAEHKGFEEISTLSFLVSELEKRGFVCYADTDNFQLIAAFEI